MNSPAWHAERLKGIGGSDASKIMAGEWLELWEIKTKRRQQEDLSGVLQVQLGIWTEDFNRQWFVLQTGHDVATGEGCEHLTHPEHTFMRANLDGRLVAAREIFEAKHVSAFAKDEDIISRYFPQVQHYLAVTDTLSCHLSVIFGNHRWASFEIERDEEYIAKLIEQESLFWGHVEEDIEPASNMPAQTVDISFDDMREVSMEGHNEWASSAADWLENKVPAKKFNDATKTLKGLVEPDVKLAEGHQVKITRAKSGALTVRAM